MKKGAWVVGRMQLMIYLLILGWFGLARAETPKFEAGQIWNYKTRKGEEGATLTVLKIEPSPTGGGHVVHIALDGLKIKNPRAPGGITTRAAHIPIDKDALANSVTKQRGEGSVPEFADGYAQWKRAKGGVFTISVAEVVDVLEQSMK